MFQSSLNPLSANFTKWPNTLKQFVGNLPTHCLSVFGHFVGLARKGLRMCLCASCLVTLLSGIISEIARSIRCENYYSYWF